MTTFIRPRWRKPAWTVGAGAVFAAAWVIRGGRPHWWLWVSLVAIATAGRAFAFYAWAGGWRGTRATRPRVPAPSSAKASLISAWSA